MVAWMGYVTTIGLGAGLAALVAERALRGVGRPVRWVWIGAMAMSVVVPLVRLLGGGGVPGGQPSFWHGLSTGLDSPVTGIGILVAWAATTLALLSNVRLSSWTLRRNERSWRTDTLAGHTVAVAAGFGPGVIGALHPRIVFPEWALAAAPALRRLILLHEIEHVRAADTRLLLGAVVLVALLPWSFPLWWQLHRLRGAIETDCDGRVLGDRVDARTYAMALVAVAARPRAPFPATGLASARNGLERRIRVITARGRRGVKAAAVGMVAASAIVIGLLFFPAPRLPDLGIRSGARASHVPLSATIILSVDGEGAAEVPAR